MVSFFSRCGLRVRHVWAHAVGTRSRCSWDLPVSTVHLGIIPTRYVSTEPSSAGSNSLPDTSNVPSPSLFWERKLAKRFVKMDMNQDGYVDQDDLESHLLLVKQTNKHSAESIEHLRQLYSRAWRRVWSFGMASSAKRVSKVQFMRGYTHLIKSPKARVNLCQTLEDLLGGCFDRFDAVNNDGKCSGVMSLAQFIEYIRCWNLSEAEGAQLFRDIAGLEAEQVNRQQYLLAAWHFYFNMDEQGSIGDNFFGRVRRASHLTF